MRSAVTLTSDATTSHGVSLWEFPLGNSNQPAKAGWQHLVNALLVAVDRPCLHDAVVKAAAHCLVVREPASPLASSGVSNETPGRSSGSCEATPKQPALPVAGTLRTA